MKDIVSISEDEHAGSAQDHRPARVRKLPHHRLGLGDVRRDAKLFGGDRDADEQAAEVERTVQQSANLAGAGGIVRESGEKRFVKVLNHRARDRAIHERQAQQPGDGGADNTASGSVGGRDGDGPHLLCGQRLLLVRLGHIGHGVWQRYRVNDWGLEPVAIRWSILDSESGLYYIGSRN